MEEPLDTELLLEAMQSDKKMLQGKLRFVVMHAIGKSTTQGEIDDSLVREVIETAREFSY